jgi:hydrogenase small subunit
VSWPIGSGHGCIGCSENHFWDDGPFYERLSSTALPGIEATPQKIGVIATAAAAAGVAAHLAALGIRRARASAPPPSPSPEVRP